MSTQSQENFVENLLKELNVGTKQASEKEDDKKDGKPAFFEKKDEDKKDKDEDKKDEKSASTKDIWEQLAELPEDLKKLASQEAQAMFNADIKRTELLGGATKAASQSTMTPEQEVALFNDAFNDQTMKLASQDGEYAELLYQEQVKMAFNMGFEQAVNEVKQAAVARQGK